MKYCKYLLITSLLAVIFLSCKKESNPYDSTYTIKFTSKAFPYIQLPENHYRIYKDSATGSLDSVIVTKSALETLFFPPTVSNGFRTAAVYYDIFTLVFTKYTSNSDTTWLSANASLLIPAYSTLSNRYNSTISLTDDTNYLQRFGMIDSDVPMASLSVEGTLYNEVIVTTSDTHDATDPFYKKIVDYWAKNVGLIKRTDIAYGGQIKTWTLLRYN